MFSTAFLKKASWIHVDPIAVYFFWYLLISVFPYSGIAYLLFVYIFLVNVDFVINWNVSLQDFILTNFLPDYLGRIGQ